MKIFKKKPRKPCLIAALFLLLASDVYADTSAQEFMHLCGMSGPCADAIVGQIAQDNATSVLFSNAAGTDTIPAFGVDANDETYIRSDSGNGVHIQIDEDAQREFRFDASSDTALTLTFGDGTVNQALDINGSTSDAADSQVLTICAGGACTHTRSSYVQSYGNEASGGGDLYLTTGNSANSDLIIGLKAATSDIQFNDSADTTFARIDQTEGLVTAAGKYLNTTAYVPTPVATPVLGTNQVLPGLNIVPTAAANTAMWLGASTPVAGQQFKIYNNAGAAVRIKGAGAAVINGGTAGKYIEMGIGSYMECMTLTTAIQQCPFYTVNGVVAAMPTPA